VLLPAAMYGDWQTVKKRMRGIVARLKRGERIIDVMSESGMLDTNDTPGTFVLAGERPGSTQNFHCFMPWKPLWMAWFDIRVAPPDPTLCEQVFHDSLTVPWGVIGLMGHENQSWFWSGERSEPFLQAVLSVWDDLYAVGARYQWSIQCQDLWSIPNNLHFVLANMGVPHERLRAPLPPGGPRELLKYARIAS
jgi:hypothetical protein